MTPEQTYLENLQTIERIAAFVAHRHHATSDETAEFKQVVFLRLLEDDYSILRKFKENSTLSTYLTTVIGRLFSQWRIEQWGKWRPCAEAKRLGDKAITLDRLLTREGYSFEEAVKILTTPEETQYTRTELEAIYVRLPSRMPRPMMISDDALPETVAGEANAEELVTRSDREKTAREAALALDRLIASMDDEDKLLLQMRFWYSWKVSEIARKLHIDQKKLYKRLDKLFLALRRGLELAGVSKSDIGRLLDPGDQEVRIDLFRDGENPPRGPSHPAGGKGVRGRRGVLQ